MIILIEKQRCYNGEYLSFNRESIMSSKKKKHKKEEELFESDDTYAFIVG